MVLNTEFTSIVLGPAAAVPMPDNGGFAEGMYRVFIGVTSHELFPRMERRAHSTCSHVPH